MADRVESVNSLVSAMEKKTADAEARRGQLKMEMDRLMDEAHELEDRANEKIGAAQALYEQIGALKYGSWTEDVLLPLADELERRTGKKAQIFGPAGISSRVMVALLDHPERRRTEQDSLELTVEPDFSGDHMVLHYETGERSDRYKHGTVGFINGLNNITAPLPDSVEEILALFRKHPAVNISKEEKHDE